MSVPANSNSSNNPAQSGNSSSTNRAVRSPPQHSIPQLTKASQQQEENIRYVSASDNPEDFRHLGTTIYTSPYPPSPPAPHGLPSLYNPPQPPLPDYLPVTDDSAAGIVRRLSNPDSALYSEDGTQVTVGIAWAVGIIGVEHFEYVDMETGMERRFRPTGQLEGVDLVAAGLPVRVWEWLSAEGIEEVVSFPASVFEEVASEG